MADIRYNSFNWKKIAKGCIEEQEQIKEFI